MSTAPHCCIVGGAGFIGRHLIDQLLARGRRITVLGRSPSPERELPQGVRYLAGDYGDARLLESLVNEVDEIVHLAHATVPQTSFDDPVEDITANLPRSVDLFKKASRGNLRKFVFVSSGGTVYGRAQSIPIDETHPTNPISPYGITKLALEKYALMYYELHRLPVIVVRPGNAYGPGQRPFRGQGFVSTAMASVLTGREITLFGEKGTLRDYIHVTDVATGIASALEGGELGKCYNIGSGEGHSNRDVIAAIEPLAARINLVPRLKVLPPRQFDVPASVLDSRRLTRDTGWKPNVSFEDGISQTWDWYFRRARGEDSSPGP